MNLIQLERIKTKDKKHLINEICLMHKKMLKSKTIAQRANLLINDSYKVNSQILNSKTISIFNTLLELLPKEEKEIITRDFINKDEYFWYLEKYSKTKYYQLKNSAMNNFLYLFYK